MSYAPFCLSTILPGADSARAELGWFRNDLATFWQTSKCRAAFCPAPLCPDPVGGLSRCRLVGSCVLPGEDFFTKVYM